MSLKLKEYFQRVNHIYYECPQDTEKMDTLDDIDNMNFKFQVQAHSNVNTKVTFNVDMKKCNLSAARDDEETILQEDVESDEEVSVSNNNEVFTNSTDTPLDNSTDTPPTESVVNDLNVDNGAYDDPGTPYSNDSVFY